MHGIIAEILESSKWLPEFRKHGKSIDFDVQIVQILKGCSEAFTVY